MKTDKEILGILKLVLPVWIRFHERYEEFYKEEPTSGMFNWHKGNQQMAEQVLKIVNNKD